jgi:hypothetical protein
LVVGVLLGVRGCLTEAMNAAMPVGLVVVVVAALVGCRRFFADNNFFEGLMDRPDLLFGGVSGTITTGSSCAALRFLDGASGGGGSTGSCTSSRFSDSVSLRSPVFLTLITGPGTTWKRSPSGIPAESMIWRLSA